MKPETMRTVGALRAKPSVAAANIEGRAFFGRFGKMFEYRHYVLLEIARLLMGRSETWRFGAELP
ncbi:MULTISPECIES: hypothetical protein [unclassified Bradyrhizobium]|uniref:hypothetical protein n=1 Tax=unclassified Bradyrhizobium TaxID=2631580 RepID=UPI0028F102BF|nr:MULTISPECIES: hypothetical protein [unclassified Bradyrhizobium]